MTDVEATGHTMAELRAVASVVDRLKGNEATANDMRLLLSKEGDLLLSALLQNRAMFRGSDDPEDIFIQLRDLKSQIENLRCHLDERMEGLKLYTKEHVSAYVLGLRIMIGGVLALQAAILASLFL